METAARAAVAGQTQPLGILRAALPHSGVSFRLVLASYAVAVALNGFLPANLGTLGMLVMFTTLIAGATFPLAISGLIVEKIPFTVFSLRAQLVTGGAILSSPSSSVPMESRSASTTWPPSPRRTRSPTASRRRRVRSV